ARATAALQRALEVAVTPAERQMAHYYQGVLAAQHEDWEAALHAWNAARAAGLTMERLEEDLQEGCHRLAEERLERGDVEGALLAGEEALRHGSTYPSLEALVSHAHQRLAHRAVSEGRWAEARRHWEKADTVDDGSFRLAFNLALAHERAEDFLAAGERWREALLLNDQPEAAANELERILDRDPDNIPALLRMGEVIYSSWQWWMGDPVRYWERVLKLDPGNAAARQLLTDYYQDQAENALRWGDPARALWMYEQALGYSPGNARVSAAIGALHVRLDELDEARPHIERALGDASDDLRVYEQILRAWLDVENLDEAWRVMEQAEATIDPIPHEFYISQASYCIDHVDRAVPLWLDRAVDQAPPDAAVFEAIGEMAAMNQAFDLARHYLERAIESNQDPGQAHLVLGLVALQEGNTARAEMHWSDALKIARQTHDEALLEHVEQARVLFQLPPELLDLIERFGPEAFMDGSLPDFLYDELDEW
ncbi:MAG: tetratricopeptide repeat protein, partial [Chloroflexota bacterium]